MESLRSRNVSTLCVGNKPTKHFFHFVECFVSFTSENIGSKFMTVFNEPSIEKWDKRATRTVSLDDLMQISTICTYLSSDLRIGPSIFVGFVQIFFSLLSSKPLHSAP